MYSQDAFTPAFSDRAQPLTSFRDPAPSLLAGYLERRLDHEQGRTLRAPLPAGVTSDLRPDLPKVGTAALMLYANRCHVDSYPLIYTILALAHPN